MLRPFPSRKLKPSTLSLTRSATITRNRLRRQVEVDAFNLEPARNKNSAVVKSVEINQRWRKDGRFNLTLSLLSENETAVFVEMCRDLLVAAEDSIDEPTALKKFWQRYKHWQNLFAAAKNDLLSEEQQRGLIGELLFLREQILNGRPLKESVAGWVGALKEHQDFSYGETWYEIKSVMEQAEKVRIPSLEQLSLERVGELVIYRLAKTSGDGFTLNSIVKNLSELLEKKFVRRAEI